MALNFVTISLVKQVKRRNINTCAILYHSQPNRNVSDKLIKIRIRKKMKGDNSKYQGQKARHGDKTETGLIKAPTKSLQRCVLQSNVNISTLISWLYKSKSPVRVNLLHKMN